MNTGMSVPVASESILQSANANLKMSNWQKVYRQLELNNIDGVTSYEVNGNLFIVVPLDEN